MGKSGLILIGLSALTLAGCSASPPAPNAAAPVQPITCTKGPDCDVKWSRAVSWVATNSSYKIQTQTDNIIQTTGPLPNDPDPAYTVTKVARAPNMYEITFGGGCESLIGCMPTIAEARAQFASFVLNGH